MLTLRACVLCVCTLLLIACTSANKQTVVPDQASPPVGPINAVILDPRLLTTVSRCAGGAHTNYAWTSSDAPTNRWHAGWPFLRHVWTGGYLTHVQLNAFPILRIRYAASNLRQFGPHDYIMMLNVADGPGEASRFVRFDTSQTEGPLASDGPGELEIDLRTAKLQTLAFQKYELPPKAELRSTWIGVGARIDLADETGPGPPASFELLELSLHRAPSDPALAPRVESAREPAGATFELAIHDTSGATLAGAEVTTDPHALNLRKIHVADPSGRLTLDLPELPAGASGSQRWIRVAHEGFVPVDLLLETNRPEAAAPIRVTLEAAARFGGRVVDAAGAPVAGASVRLAPNRINEAAAFSTAGPPTIDTFRPERFAVLTDSNGRWISPPMPAERREMDVIYTHPDFISNGETIRVADEALTRLRARSHEHTMNPGIVIAGRVRPAAGGDPQLTKSDKPQSLLVGQGGVTRLSYLTPDGAFRHFPLSPGAINDWTLVLRSDAHVKLVRPLADLPRDGLGDLSLTWPAGQSIDGVVTDRTGAPIPGVRLSALPRDLDVRGMRAGGVTALAHVTRRTEDDGTFTLTLPEGHPPMVLYLVEENKTNLARPLAEVTAGSERLTIELEL